MAITYREAEQMVYDALDAYAHRNVGRDAAASDVLGVLRGLMEHRCEATAPDAPEVRCALYKGHPGLHSPPPVGSLP